jgi:hypothetical protein
VGHQLQGPASLTPEGKSIGTYWMGGWVHAVCNAHRIGNILRA